MKLQESLDDNQFEELTSHMNLKLDKRLIPKRENFNNTSRWVFECIVHFCLVFGYQPSLEEIRVMCRFSTVQSVIYHLNKLQRCGFIDFDRGKKFFRIPCLNYSDRRKYDPIMKNKYDEFEAKLQQRCRYNKLTSGTQAGISAKYRRPGINYKKLRKMQNEEQNKGIQKQRNQCERLGTSEEGCD